MIIMADTRTMPMYKQYKIDHLHDLTGECVKNRYGVRCGRVQSKVEVSI